MRQTSRRTARLLARAAAVTTVSVALCAGSLVETTPASASLVQTVIVTGAPGVNVVGDVLTAAGTIVDQLPLINGVVASVPSLLLGVLEVLPGINVTPDLSVSVQSTVPSTGPHTPSDAFLAQTGATALAAAGDTGQGVTVAVLDTGIDALPDFTGRLIGGVDLTGGGHPYTDRYGHGTFVAGLIAGNGASSKGVYSGEAPGANLVAIKVAGASGTTDLAAVLNGVQWAVNHKAAYKIRVLNMSLGFKPIGSTILDPLDMAVEAAWNSGIAVVTSAGNAGPFNGSILAPADDPLAITVGASDDLAQPVVANDEMTTFSSAGPTNPDGWAKPDLVASGRSVVSLAAPGSTIYNQNPSARIGSGNFVGSGTSFSAAITSGAAALVLQQNPGITPNQLKARLLATAAPGPLGNPFVDGHGVLEAASAARAANVNLAQSTLGEILTKLGSSVSLTPAGAADTWNPSLWSGVNWTGAVWNGHVWNGDAWSGSDWNSFVWTGHVWNEVSWGGAAWNGAVWNGSAWTGHVWNEALWGGAAWSGATWNSSQWS